MLYFSCPKIKKKGKYFWHVPRWNYFSLLHVERYILIRNFLHCQYVIYETKNVIVGFENFVRNWSIF